MGQVNENKCNNSIESSSVVRNASNLYYLPLCRFVYY